MTAKRTHGAGINLDDERAFCDHEWIKQVATEYEQKAALALAAMTETVHSLEALNASYHEEKGCVAFTTVEGRVKTRESYLRKLHKKCLDKTASNAFTQKMIREAAASIHDVCGVRFSCPYFDEIKQAVQWIRPALRKNGFGTDLKSRPGLADRDYLDTPDESGYRSYHFFVLVPTIVDIYGHKMECLCEIQARSELQHVWAVKSHSLLYKPDRGWDALDDDVVKDMRAVSDNLKAADQFLVSIRNRSRGKA